MKKRKWVYLNKPQNYDIQCDKCGGTNIAWSEYDQKIWCYDCQIDTKGTPGIFDGPIGLQACEILGCTLNRFYLKSRSICKPVVNKSGRIVYRRIITVDTK